MPGPRYDLVIVGMGSGGMVAAEFASSYERAEKLGFLVRLSKLARK